VKKGLSLADRFLNDAKNGYVPDIASCSMVCVDSGKMREEGAKIAGQNIFYSPFAKSLIGIKRW
jgi:hypothetical protein